MNYDTDYEKLLQTSLRVNWRVEDIIGNGTRMDFSKPFLPESFCPDAGAHLPDAGRAAGAEPDTRLWLSRHVRAR